MVSGRRQPASPFLPRLGAAAAAAGWLMTSIPAAADPPPWAPAHGYRQKEAPAYVDEPAPPPPPGYVVEAPRPTGTVPDGIARGRCNRAAVGAVLGGAVGGILGSRIGEGGGKAAATIAGTLLGMVIGGSIGRSMDEADRYCLGQTLEYARDRQPVRWSNPDSGVEYVATPTSSYREHSEYCRRFVTEVRRGDRTERIPETACRRSDGSWVTVAGR